MDTLMRVFRDIVADLPLRSLLYTTGAAATAAAIYYYSRRGDGEERTAEQEDTPAAAGPVCVQAPEPALVQPIELSEDQTKDYEGEREAHNIHHVDNDELKKSLMHNEELVKECEQEREACNILQAENNEMKRILIQKEELLKAFEQERETHRSPKSKYDKMKNTRTQKEDTLKEIVAQLETETSDLTAEVKNLRVTVQEMGELLSVTHRECDHLKDECEREQMANSILQKENDEVKKMLSDKEEILKVSLAEANEKHEKAVKNIAQIKAEKSDLINEVKTLQYKLQQMGDLLSETW